MAPGDELGIDEPNQKVRWNRCILPLHSSETIQEYGEQDGMEDRIDIRLDSRLQSVRALE